VVDDRIVSVSLSELIVDMVRSDTTLDALSEPEDGAMPMSCLCAPQWTSDIDVNFQRMSRSWSRTSRADGRSTGSLLSMRRTRLSMCGTARNASSSYSQAALASIIIQVSSLSRFAWNDVSVLELLPPIEIFCFDVLCLTKSCGFFFSIKDMISRKTQPKEKTSAFSLSCTRERGLGLVFTRLNPKLNPAKSAVGDFVNF